MAIFQSVVVAVSSSVALSRTIKKKSTSEILKFHDSSQGGPAAGNDRPASCGSGDLAAGDGSVPAAPTSAPERDAQARAQRTTRMFLRHTAATPSEPDMPGLSLLHLTPPSKFLSGLMPAGMWCLSTWCTLKLDARKQHSPKNTNERGSRYALVTLGAQGSWQAHSMLVQAAGQREAQLMKELDSLKARLWDTANRNTDLER